MNRGEIKLKCADCGETYDPLDLDQVLFHCAGHIPRPDAQYSASARVEPPLNTPDSPLTT